MVMELLTYSPWSFLIAILAFIFLAKTLISKASSNKKRLPPGPPALPIFGHVFQLGTQPHKVLTGFAASYGPIITLKFGTVKTIIISSSTLAKQALIVDGDHFSTPFKLDAVYSHEHDRLSIGWLPASSPRWRALRKIWIGHLIGGRRLDAMRPHRAQRVSELLDLIRQCAHDGVAVDIARVSQHTFFNIMLTTNFSKDLLDPNGFSKSLEIEELITEIIALTRKPNLVDCFPILHVFDPQGIRRRLTTSCKKLFKIFDAIIDARMEQRKATKVSSSHDDALEALLDIIEEQKDDIDKDIMRHLLMDVIGLGMDTTMRSVEWSMTELLRNPKTLQKCQRELEEKIGKGKAVEETDVSKLPYLQAVIRETLRVHPPAPFLLPRKIEQDVEIGGYMVPKGARVLFNVWAIGRDPDRWENPESFEPDRFLGSGLDLGQHCDMIPFGAGRRICPGVSMALRLVPSVLGSMINCFDWKLESGISPEDLDMEDVVEITLARAKPLRAIPMNR